MKILDWMKERGESNRLNSIKKELCIEVAKFESEKELFDLEKELSEDKESYRDRIRDTEIDYNESKSAIQRDYFYQKESLNTEIAKLQANRSFLKEEFEVEKNSMNKQLSAKDREIERLNKIIEQLIGKFPKVEVNYKQAA